MIPVIWNMLDPELTRWTFVVTVLGFIATVLGFVAATVALYFTWKAVRDASV